MASLSDYQLKLLQLQTALSKLNTDVFSEILQIIQDNQQNFYGSINAKTPLILSVSDLRERLLDDHNNEPGWMNYFAQIETWAASTGIDADNVLNRLKNKASSKLMLRFLHTAHDLLLCFALELSGTIGAENSAPGFGSMRVNLLNREDPDVLLVLQLVSDINLCIEFINGLEQPKNKGKNG